MLRSLILLASGLLVLTNARVLELRQTSITPLRLCTDSEAFVTPGSFLEVRSPSYPEGHYADNTRCNVALRSGTQDIHLTVRIETLGLEQQQNCVYDFLCINGVLFCGSWASGNVYEYIVPANSSFTLDFKSDGSVTGPGLYLTISATAYSNETLSVASSGVGSSAATIGFSPFTLSNSTYTDSCGVEASRFDSSNSTPSYYTPTYVYYTGNDSYSTNFPWYYNTTTYSNSSDYPWYYTSTYSYNTDYPWYYTSTYSYNTDYPWYYTSTYSYNTDYPMLYATSTYSYNTGYPYYYSSTYNPYNTDYPWYYTSTYSYNTNYPYYYSSTYNPYNTDYPWYYTSTYSYNTNYPYYYSSTYNPYNTDYPWYYTSTYSYNTDYPYYYSSTYNPYSTDYPWYYSTTYNQCPPGYYCQYSSTPSSVNGHIANELQRALQLLLTERSSQSELYAILTNLLSYLGQK